MVDISRFPIFGCLSREFDLQIESFKREIRNGFYGEEGCKSEVVAKGALNKLLSEKERILAVIHRLGLSVDKNTKRRKRIDMLIDEIHDERGDEGFSSSYQYLANIYINELLFYEAKSIHFYGKDFHGLTGDEMGLLVLIYEK